MKLEERKELKKIVKFFFIEWKNKKEDITYKDIPILNQFLLVNNDFLKDKKFMWDLQKLIDSSKIKFVKDSIKEFIKNFIKEAKDKKDITLDKIKVKYKDFFILYKDSIEDLELEKMIFEENKKYINNVINNFLKEHNRFPKYKDLWKIDLEKYIKNNKEYLTFILKWIEVEYFDKFNNSTPKMKKLFKELFLKEKENFNKFFILNNQNIVNDEFQTIWTWLKTKIEEIENELLKTVENSQYSYWSSSINDKFYNFINMFFPKYNFIWVKIRKI